DLRDAVLTGASLTVTALSGADLSGATLTGATLRDVRAERLTARNTDLGGVQVISGILSAADLSGADLRGARFTDTDLTDAVLTGSRWSRAGVLGGRLGPAVGAPELAVAALAGRDPAQVMLRSASSPQYAVAVSPDTTMI
ncbi:pentapeptide repeat-containing protein, partial [Frankia sp. CiP3]|uniref:pentapeptide repeat-containing protein n=1 Tax=Frankia sp. CiP3 TaxID=2880971 RepID=UPI001EF49B8B